MQTKPLISVIVIAHDRKQYISRAIASVLNQTLNRRLYEIIVVKRFKDKKIDRNIRMAGARNMFTKAVPLGAKFALGIRASRGEVITFLEDDDTYRSRRLARIRDAFRNPNVCYYVNSMMPVDTSGRENRALMKNPRVVRVAKTTTASLEMENPLRLNHGGISSIAVSSSIAKRYWGMIDEFTTGLDDFMFFASLASNRLLYFDREYLTDYTIHESSLSNASSATANTYVDFRRRKVSQLEGILHTYGKIAKVVGGSKLEKFVRFEVSHDRAAINLLSDREVYKISADDCLNMLRESRYAGTGPIMLLFASMVHRLFPRATSILYYKTKQAMIYRP